MAHDDERQQTFNKVAKKIGDSNKDAKIQVNRNIDGYTATHIDLGAIQSCIKEDDYLNKRNCPDRIKDLIIENVDRVKRIEVNYEDTIFDDAYDIKIKFTTKDDYGWYDYSFYARIWEEE